MTALLALAVTQFALAGESLELKVGNDIRKATVFAQTAKPNAPLVFVFHGFTGNATHAAAAYRVHREWPEAIVVYPQGLEVSLLNRKGPGWQIAPRMQEDRDLKFFDAMLAKLSQEHKFDPKRVYTCGMSNGAIFSYLLLAERGSKFAAAAPVAGFGASAFRDAPATPILIIHGEKDDLLPLKQAERSRDLAIENNAASSKTKMWADGYTLYPGKDGADVVWHVHDGGHIWPADATANLVKFFKAHKRS